MKLRATKRLAEGPGQWEAEGCLPRAWFPGHWSFRFTRDSVPALQVPPLCPIQASYHRFIEQENTKTKMFA